MLKKINPGFILLLLFATLFFFATRINPLLNHQVAYTYDQGRDFLKASELVEQKNLTFIGPTTGIMGLFHGAWWYYLLTVPYLIFQGLPIGFYYFNFLIHWMSLLLLVGFAYFEFGLLMAVFTALLVISAPYFIFSSLFVGNNIMAIPSVLILLISLFYLLRLKKPNTWLFLLNGISLGLVSEFELSFGLFLIPSYFVIIILFPILRASFFNIKKLLFFLFGLGLIFLPRILFELKNGFSQTKILLNFFLKPKLHNPKPLLQVIKDRWHLFGDYYHSLFINDSVWIIVSLFLLLMVIFILIKKRSSLLLKIYGSLLFLLFTISLVYKDNFWGNYYEGIHYLFLFIMLLIIKQLTKSIVVRGALLLINLLLIIFVLIKVFTPTPPGQLSGLAAHEKIVDYLYQHNSSGFSVDIYTPPAIPYTYRYLFFYQNKFLGKLLPMDSWQNNLGWYILESDDFVERKQDWIDTRIPNEAKLIKNHRIGDVDIQLWKKQ